MSEQLQGFPRLYLLASDLRFFELFDAVEESMSDDAAFDGLGMFFAPVSASFGGVV